ncbi:BatD family protein [Congregibacter litoralis]|uniref:Oxygen tolerance n=1 Tax=Congregibacter litoralis KT71 TaxID=314285 RepID=A4ADS1_9GAMM|nr:BatD family protein [Congregibacter litoralis]EAQ95879.2 Oxygen tolerance [Congregibacter litoralis KT71]
MPCGLQRLPRLGSALGQFLATLIILGFCAGFSHGATTLDKLIADDQLQMTVDITTEGTLYQRAPFVLVVEVATARWFSRGTRVRDFRIPGAVVRPVSNFANNSSRRINGETWSVQQWRFRVFPREAGSLELPSLRVFASVNTEEGTVEGERLLYAAPVLIVAPPGADEFKDWIATPSLTVAENWAGTLESYLPGDAITRTRRFMVKDAPAMMLVGSKIDDVEGLSLYAAPATVADQSDRGALTGRREETLVVTFEAPGSYQLPGLEYAWFNTTSGEFEQLSLPPFDIEVTAAAPAASDTREDAQASLLNTKVVIPALLLLTILAILWSARKTPVAIRIRRTLVARRARRERYRRYLRALGQEDSSRCLQLLYDNLGHASALRPQHAVKTGQSPGSLRDALDLPAGASGDEAHDSDIPGRALECFLEHAYGGGDALPHRDAAIALWNAIDRHSRKKFGTDAGGLRLNPAPST